MKKYILILFLLLSYNAYGAEIFNDAFTEASTITLQTHTPSPTGTSWTKISESCSGTVNWNDDAGDFAVPSAAATDCSNNYKMAPAPTSSAYDVTVDFIDAGTVGATDCSGIYGRGGVVANNYFVGVCDDVGNTYQLGKRVSDVVTVLGTGGAFSDTNTDTIRFEITDGQKKVYENGTEIVSSTDNAHTAAGTAGLWCGQIMVPNDDCNTTIHFDNFIVTEVAAARKPIITSLSNIVYPPANAQEVRTGRWMISPVIHRGSAQFISRIAKIWQYPECHFSSAIGNADIANEYALSYVTCSDYTAIGTDSQIIQLIDESIDSLQAKVNSLSQAKKDKLIAAVQNKLGVTLNENDTVAQWLEQLGKKMNPTFEPYNTYTK